MGRKVISLFLPITWMFPKFFFLAKVEIGVVPAEVAISMHVNYNLP